MCVGSTLFLLAAKNDENTLSSDELKQTYLRPTSVVFVSVSLSFLIASLLIDKCIKSKTRKYYHARCSEPTTLKHMI